MRHHFKPLNRILPLHLITALVAFFIALCSARSAEAQNRDLGREAFVMFRAAANKFKDASDACKSLRPPKDGESYSSNTEDAEGRVTCKFKAKDEKDKKKDIEITQSGVIRILDCPAGSYARMGDGTFTANARMGMCVCNVGLVAAGTVCLKPEEVPPEAPKTSKPAAETKCTWEKTSTQTGDTSKNSAILRKNLGATEGDKKEAHHIVFSTWKDGERGRLATESRAILDKFCIDINSVENGALLDHKQHHGKGLHTIVAATTIQSELSKAKDRSEALKRLASLKKRILAGDLVPGYTPKPRPVPLKPKRPEPETERCTEEDE
jgi:hypothetical protein